MSLRIKEPHEPLPHRTMIKTKSVYSDKEPKKDGLRILATRIRGRGLPKTAYDIWMANLAPSQKLKDDFQSGKITWPAFRGLYRKELFESDSFDKKNRVIKNRGQKYTLRLIQKLAKRGTVTVMCHCAEDERNCHRHILKKLLYGKI
jgi:uncharacterized protein YeaO (DUF488 family)